MTRLFTNGFEEANQLAIWTNVTALGDSPALLFGPIASGAYAQLKPRTGKGQAILSSAMYLTYEWPTPVDDVYVGLAFNTGLFQDVRMLYLCSDSPGNYGNYGDIKISAAGVITIERTNTAIATSAAGVVSIDTWHYMEVYFKPRNAAGEFTVKIDGVQVVTFSGDTTNDLQTVNAIRLCGCNNNSGNYSCYDDLVVNSGDGSVNNTYPGQVRLLPIRPQSAGNYAQWDTGGVDLGAPNAQVRQGWDFAVRQTSTADEYDTFTPDVPDLPVGATIANVIVNVQARVEAGAGVVAPMIRQNGVDDIGTDLTLSTGYVQAQEVWSENPDTSAPWVEADLADLEIGYSS